MVAVFFRVEKQVRIKNLLDTAVRAVDAATMRAGASRVLWFSMMADISLKAKSKRDVIEAGDEVNMKTSGTTE
jgi:hypothetical protein